MFLTAPQKIWENLTLEPKNNRGFWVEAATYFSVCSTVHEKGCLSLVYSAVQTPFTLKFRSLNYCQLLKTFFFLLQALQKCQTILGNKAEDTMNDINQ